MMNAIIVFWLIYHGLNDNKHNDVMCIYSVEDNINKEYQSPFRETGSRPLILTYNKISSGINFKHIRMHTV